MAGVTRQLEYLEPILNKSHSIQDVLRDLIGVNEEEYFHQNQGNILHKLGLLKNQYSFYTFDHDFTIEDLFEKIKALLAQNGFTRKFKVENRDGWILTLDEKEHNLGDTSLFYNWTVNAGQILSIPPFYRKIASALSEYLKSGDFHFGYWKNEDQRGMLDYIFVILYVPDSEKNILSKFSSLEWNSIGTKNNAKAITGKVSLVSYSITENETTFKWKSRGNTLTTILFMAAALLFLAGIDQLFGFSEFTIPQEIFIYSISIIVPLWILDYFNRFITLTFNEEKLILNQGYLPFFPGYKRRNYLSKDILRIWNKIKKTSAVSDDFNNSDFYYIYITTTQPKEIRLTSELDKSETKFIEAKLSERLRAIMSI